MKNLPRKILQTTLLTSGFLLLNACGGGSSKTTDPTTQQATTQELAMKTILAYATSNGTSTAPTVKNYVDVGVIGIDNNNIDDMNQVVGNSASVEVDSKAKLQTIATNLGADTTAPVFTSSATSSVNENQTSAITLLATDDHTVTYSIANADATSFHVDASSGVVTFNTAPDFELKKLYNFTATATDEAGNNATQDVMIHILNVTEGIMHNGVSYGTVVSPYTGKVWLDRNLGASQVCTKFDDSACYGDYYQWGRAADGHEKSTSGKTTILATDINNAGSDFIISEQAKFYDWARGADNNGSLRSLNWSKTDGSSICPVGFSVPTIEELKVETIDASDKNGSTKVISRVTAFTNFLKLPQSGYKSRFSNVLADKGNWGALWANSVSNSVSKSIHFDFDAGTSDFSPRGNGLGVRCLKD